uniref:Uncharacterized protein n=1 Tax=Globodera rostochiensis TaxID=31243 RepID=A0A914GTA3_GLORO
MTSSTTSERRNVRDNVNRRHRCDAVRIITIRALCTRRTRTTPSTEARTSTTSHSISANGRRKRGSPTH